MQSMFALTHVHTNSTRTIQQQRTHLNRTLVLVYNFVQPLAVCSSTRSQKNEKQNMLNYYNALAKEVLCLRALETDSE